MLMYVVAAGVALMSIGPVMNMLSPRQMMNASSDPLHLVNTYGAFGSVTRERYEIVLEGTDDSRLTDRTTWREYRAQYYRYRFTTPDEHQKSGSWWKRQFAGTFYGPVSLAQR
jgi:hypothetical protein